MTRLIVAAGGGGDAVAAAMLHAALYGSDRVPAVIFTYAWDRLLIDPVPGPKAPVHFSGLRSLTPSVRAVPAAAAPVPPARSTLPRLAAELPHTFALLDPYSGAVGITRQLEELINHLEPESIDLLDVGGDILARGDEPTLRSPLADALTLAACAEVLAPIRLLVAGPGLDAELPADILRPRLGPLVTTFTPEHADAIASVLDWHPSETIALLAAAARDIRGRCEVLGTGIPVPLTDESPTVHEVELDAALSANRIARALLDSTSLDQAEEQSRRLCGFSEIDYERDRATWAAEPQPAKLDPDTVLPRLDTFEAEARANGITHVTIARIAEALNGTRRTDLRELLISSRPEQYDPPLWRVARA